MQMNTTESRSFPERERAAGYLASEGRASQGERALRDKKLGAPETYFIGFTVWPSHRLLQRALWWGQSGAY